MSDDYPVHKTEEQWRSELTPTQYAVTRQGATEPPFSGAYWDTEQPGIYRCICCHAVLFDSQTKFDAGCGWPSYYAPIDEERIERRMDYSHGMVRVEIRCKNCGAHLGHVFEDGPEPTGLRYCINSASLDFEASDNS